MYKTFLLAFLLPSQLFSAVYLDISNEKIQWDAASKKFNSLKGAFSGIGFNGAELNAANNFLPVWKKSVKIPANTDISFNLSNEVYTPISKTLISDTTQITNTVKIDFRKGTIQKQAYAFVNLLPIRKNATTGLYERLVSFDLNTQIATDYTKPAHNSRGGSRSTYAAASALATGNWHKVSVEKNGIYRISYTLLKEKFKIDPAGIQLDKLSVWGTPGALLNETAGTDFVDDLTNIPLEVIDNNGNNKFDADDYILFYAQGPDSWGFDINDNLFHHTKHLYSTKNFYFISTDKQRNILGSKPNASGSTKTLTTFDDFDFRENDQYNLDESGRVWLGNRMSSSVNSATFSFSFPNMVKTEPQKITSKVAGSSTISYLSLAIDLKLSESGTNITTHKINGTGNGSYHNVARESRGVYSASSATDNPTYTYSFTSYDPGGNATAYVDFIEVNCKRQLQMTGDVMHFRSTEANGAAAVTFQLSGVAPGIKVLDITDPVSPVIAGQANGSTYDIITADSLHEYVAYYTKNTLPEPEYVSTVGNQNLHAIGFPDMIIIRPDNYFAAASDKLADFHRNEDGLIVEVVTLQNIYNEFSSGKQDISAIRNFIKMLYERAGNDTSLIPRYLCLMGDGSFDMRGITGQGGNFIPTFQSYESFAPTTTFSSDDFYGLLDNGEGGGSILYNNNYLDMGVGRLPVTTDDEAMGVVNKIINYKSKAALGNWRNVLSFVADDEDGNTHLDSTESLAERARKDYPVYNYDKIYLDAYQQSNTPAGPRFPDVNNAILNAIYKGTLLVNYVGHGGINNWSLERIFNMNDIQQLNNFNKLPLFITATCEFSKFDKNGGQTAGEALINNSKGGAIGLITTVRLVYSNQNDALNSALFEHLFEPYNGRNPTLGELLVATKNNISLDENNRKFVLLGDPALKLNYPENNIVTTSVNGVAMNQLIDTIKALQQVTITGEVRTPAGTKMSSFNGVVYPTVYDKISTLTTLQNDANSPKRNFVLYKGILFNGKATVVNGEFSFSFLMPKDIDYKIGEGRISYYADDLNKIDAHGFESDIVIGSSIDSIPPDDQGPTVRLFMNDTTFINGGITDANPILLAILEDDYGINVGNSLGHEITAVLDEASDKPTILNDFYESELNNFRKGKVKYPFYKLTDGTHTLTVKAWDTQNNSTEESIEFLVSTSSAIALQHLMNYPNPFSNNTTIAFEHNMAGQPVSIQVEIFNTAGSKVSSIQENLTPEGYRTLINWAGNTNDGGDVQQGLYIYRVTLTDQAGNVKRATSKLVVIK